MTKYLLNSGGISNSSDKGRAFFRDIVKDLGDNPKVLFCFFASPREDWEEKYASYVTGFKNQLPENVTPTFELAFPAKFTDQVSVCDAIYLHGGDDNLVQYWLKQFNLPKLFEGKVVATNSAGSNAIATYSWTCDWRQCIGGLGILPIKFIAHYLSEYGKQDPRGPIDWAAAKAELSKYGDTNLPIHALKEGEYITLEVS